MKPRKCPSGGQPPVKRAADGAGQCPTCKQWFDKIYLRRNPMGGVRLPSHTQEKVI